MRIVVLAAACVVLSAATAAAQQPQQPMGRMAIDVRGFYTVLGQDPTTAKDLNVDPTLLPHRGLGLEADVHYLLLRGQSRGLGIVGQAIVANGHAQQKDDTGQPVGEPISQRLRGISAGVSLDFGHRDGWSYLSAAFGPLAFPTFVGATPPSEAAPVDMTVNLGGGARWFSSKHFAFCFDMRFYQTVPHNTTPSYPGRARKQLLIISGGLSVR